jgi:hypothetical protein
MLFVLMLILAGCGTPASTLASASVVATATPIASPMPGAITGQIGYPANFVPPVTVYAVNQADRRIFFSVDTLRYPPATLLPGPQSTYTITGVVPGTYIVFAYRNDHDPYDSGGPAVYSQHLLKCVPPPATAICDDHTLVPVVVQAGQTVAGIDVKDWLNNVQKVTAPPRP